MGGLKGGAEDGLSGYREKVTLCAHIDFFFRSYPTHPTHATYALFLPHLLVMGSKSARAISRCVTM